jgi:hypothetical protein
LPFPKADNLITTILIILTRSAIITVIFGGGILLWRVSEDISAGFGIGWKLIKTSILRIK